MTKRPYIRLLRSLGCHISLCTIGFYTTAFNRSCYRIGASNARLWKIWFTIGILVALATAMTACGTLIVLPMKYIYELQRRSSTHDETLMRTNAGDETRLLTENGTQRSKALDNERDSLLIQPIVRERVCFSSVRKHRLI